MTTDFAAGNYRFIPAVFQYSAGAAALAGYEIERVRFDRMPPLAEGFAKIAEYIKAAGRPLTSFCACELRSPAAFTDQGFLEFNRHYVKTLTEWGIYDGKTNPVARSNVCPEIDPPAEPSFYAFSFVRPSRHAMPSFVIAGSGEALEGAGPYSERTVRYRDLSPDGIRDKVRHVVGAMESRMAAFGFGWQDATAGLDGGYTEGSTAGTPLATPVPEYKRPNKKWRVKRGAVPQWYRQRHGVRAKAQSGAARVARFRPPAMK